MGLHDRLPRHSRMLSGTAARLAIAAILLVPAQAFAQEAELDQIAKGEMVRHSAKGIPAGHGLNVSVSYPKSWVKMPPIAGVVHAFKTPDGTGTHCKLTVLDASKATPAQRAEDLIAFGGQKPIYRWRPHGAQRPIHHPGGTAGGGSAIFAGRQ